MMTETSFETNFDNKILVEDLDKYLVCPSDQCNKIGWRVLERKEEKEEKVWGWFGIVDEKVI